MKPIYEPKGAAKEYGDLAINIYTGCPHKCFYCFAPSVLRRDRETFSSCVKPREGIDEAVKKQIEKEHITGKLIHLCFVCDPYPIGYDDTPTREIIKILKDSGNNVQILSKHLITRDFDLLDENDWVGITYDGTQNPNAGNNNDNFDALSTANIMGIKTWVSFEPVLDAENVIDMLNYVGIWVDKVKIGKLNYCKAKTNIDWKKFGEFAEEMCQDLEVDYYIKDSLRQEMNRGKEEKL